MTPDFRLLNCGTIILLTPCSPAATRWTKVHLPAHACRYGETAIAIEPRYFSTIADAILDADMTIHGEELRIA